MEQQPSTERLGQLKRPSTSPSAPTSKPPTLFDAWATVRPSTGSSHYHYLHPVDRTPISRTTPRSHQAMLQSEQLTALHSSPPTTQIPPALTHTWSLPARPSTSPSPPPSHSQHLPPPPAPPCSQPQRSPISPGPASPLSRPPHRPSTSPATGHPRRAAPPQPPPVPSSPPSQASVDVNTTPGSTPAAAAATANLARARDPGSPPAHFAPPPPGACILAHGRDPQHGPDADTASPGGAFASGGACLPRTQQGPTTCSTGVQSAPAPWTRYFFPDDLNSYNPRPGTPFYQYFDVRTDPRPNPPGRLPPVPMGAPPHLQHHAPPPPEWAADAYMTLAHIAMDTDCSEPHPTASDVVQGGAALVTPSGLAAHWGQVRQWGTAVAALRPRSWSDAQKLAKLHGGVITYLLQQLAAAPDAPTAEFMWECGRRLEAQAHAAEAAAQLVVEQEVERLHEAAEARLHVLRTQAGREAGEELGGLLARSQKHGKQLQEQLARAQAALEQREALAAAANAQIERLGSEVERLVTRLQQQEEAAAAQEAQLRGQVAELQAALDGATGAVLEAIRGQDLEGVWPMASAAVLHLTAAPCAYCATFEPAEEEGQLPTPAASSCGDGAADARCALSRSSSTRPGAGGAGGSGRTSHVAARSLVLRYVAASPGLEFIVGQELPSGTGASWQLLEGACELDVPEVDKQPAMRWLRPNGAALQLRGSFFAVAVTDLKGMVVGLVAADTCLPGGEGKALAEGDKAVIRKVAAAVCAALATQEREFLKMLDHNPDGFGAAEAGKGAKGGAKASVLEEAQGFADLLGGRMLLRQAMSDLAAVTEADVQQLVELPDSSASAWAVVKGAAGLLLPPTETHDWGTLRRLVSRPLLQAAMDLEIDAVDWKHLRVAAAEVLCMPAFAVLSEGRVVTSLYCWLTAIKKLTAHYTATSILQERLSQTNQVVTKAFSDPNGGSIRELRSLRAPPAGTAVLLRAVLQLLGHPPATFTAPWARCRAQVSPDLARSMAALRPAQLTQSSLDIVAAALERVSEECAHQECTAGVLLHAWLAAIAALLSSPTHAINRNSRPPSEAATLQLQHLLAS